MDARLFITTHMAQPRTTNLRPEYADLSVEVQERRAAGAKRKDASLYVCRKLLFDLGVAPTAALVREITGWGSNSDVTADVQAFFQGLTNPGGAPFPASGLPVDLQEAFGQCLVQLHHHALGKAAEAFEDDRLGFEQARLEGETREHALREDLRISESQRDAARAAQSEAAAQIEEANLALTASEDERGRLVAQLQVAQNELSQALGALAAARAELANKTEQFTEQLRQVESAAEARRAPLMRELDATRQKLTAAEHQAREAGERREAAERAAQTESSQRMLAERDAAAARDLVTSKNDLLAARAAEIDAQKAHIASLEASLEQARLQATEGAGAARLAQAEVVRLVEQAEQNAAERQAEREANGTRESRMLDEIATLKRRVTELSGLSGAASDGPSGPANGA
ncbi:MULTISPECIES: DNA-binding protein [unclassified Burkholderia]|uniref:DNA-binding protein n=1 Tax=unclassified Burkholderia TaxID=2613784 RepID=UPI002AAFBDF7|nr:MULTISPECIES: DNA-binding protein [unclassified Burkholderia]